MAQNAGAIALIIVNMEENKPCEDELVISSGEVTDADADRESSRSLDMKDVDEAEPGVSGSAGLDASATDTGRISQVQDLVSIPVISVGSSLWDALAGGADVEYNPLEKECGRTCYYGKYVDPHVTRVSLAHLVCLLLDTTSISQLVSVVNQ